MQLDLNEQVAENKLIILYLIEKVNFELTNSQILKLLVKINEINYFLLQEYISQLINDNYLKCRIESNQRLYKITESGKEALSYFKTMIRASTRKQIDTAIEENITTLRTEIQVSADYIPINEDEYTVFCRITEGSTCLVELNLYAGTKEQAKVMCRNWEKNSQQIYSEIVNLLIQEK
ncbi:MAG: DUF4364 family protein [Deltaproteobacteria bacterium]